MKPFLGSVGVRGSVRGPFFTRHQNIYIYIHTYVHTHIDIICLYMYTNIHTHAIIINTKSNSIRFYRQYVPELL